MDFNLPDETRMMRETVARFVRTELMPLESLAIRREAERGLGDAPLIPPEVEAQLQQKVRSPGMANRCLQMMVEQANRRSTFGALLADRQVE
ncbi:MAG: hypothetical protein A3G24_19130 [Betaproteobacteria bacterium RIFCSPLOWO2_12_FULL_62_13]|nr:MAG: hypothetical protein A3G24_19130 [Betaproteobacteria bacterium RIFCSPLOWO2_12_FULL_62_13]